MQFFKPLALSAMLALASHAGAAVVHNSDIVGNAIFGNGGNADGGWTITQTGNMELALRAKVRYSIPGDQPQNVFNANGDGTFNHAAGSPASNPTRARWNFEWSINTDASGTGGEKISAYSYVLGIDTDAGFGTTYATISLLASYFDHSFGNNSTAESGGAEAADLAGMLGLAAANNLMQNSWNMDFFDNGVIPGFPGIFNPAANGNYSFYLQALDQTGAEVGRTDITVIVGTGAVPEPASLALVGVALLGAAAARRRKT